jgi:hypothetical protein
MDKYITFDVEESTARISAEFWSNKVMKNRKYLTRIEEEALEPIFEEFPCDVDAGWMYKALEDGCYFFDNNGEATNFEEMVYELVKENK